NSYIISTPDNCDFFRLILPPDSGQKLLNIKDYYRDGKLRAVAKAKKSMVDKSNGQSLLEGQCIMYFPSGKRQCIINYHNGSREGVEYQYYSNGNLFCAINHRGLNDNVMWDCFDLDGSQLCKGGTGLWKKYDSDFKTILEQGPVKDGVRNGQWHETTFMFDTIRYIADYKSGSFKSGISYDKNGHSYSFKKEQEPPFYEGGEGDFNFFDDIKHYLKIPRDSIGKKMNLDTPLISFTIDYDGKIIDPEVITKIDIKLASAIKDAVLKCKGWHCRKFYGIPFRSRLTFPITYIENSNNIATNALSVNSVTKKTHYNEKILPP
ncbi:MAG TPA: hypothetical protein VL442_14660, partial [Mucilaginibacter sp.]|nr:hypothetical protein [Mucilaginibacter sp.]